MNWSLNEDKVSLQMSYLVDVFLKNPSNDFAARLIEKADLKGSRVGGISISKKHSNYFINDGNGTAEDFINLINNVKEKVLEKYKIKLEEEVIIIK